MKPFTYQSPSAQLHLPCSGAVALIAIIAATCLTAPSASAARHWEMTGTINYVHPTLSGTFTKDETFTISLDMDEDAALRFKENISSHSSRALFDQAISNGTITFPRYAATFASQENVVSPGGSLTYGDGGMEVRNGRTNASTSVAYDQLTFDFTSFGGGITSAPTVAGLELGSIGFNFFSDSAPLNMITGSQEAFPAIDAFFPTPDNFNLARSTNPIYHLDLRFNDPTFSGTIFIRGSINTLTFSEIGGGFAEWPALATAPADQRGPNDTPAGDGVANIIKYALGISPLESANARLPSKVVEGQGGDAGFPVVSFIRVKDLTGALIEVEVSADLDFTNGLGSTVINKEDLGDGSERITVRSNASFSSSTKQFFRLKVTGS